MRFLVLFIAVALSPFALLAQPAISSFTPTSAADGATVTISGTGFTGTISVTFGGKPALSFIEVTDSEITAVVDGGNSGSVSVTTGAGTDSFGSFIYDNDQPSVVISSTATDPTNVSPIPVTITFNESVTGFVEGDINVTNGTATGFAGSGTTYTANITPAGAGEVTVSVAANVAVDAASNANTASNTLSRTFDNSVPTVVISSTATDPTSVSPIPVTITFSESVTGFVEGDITVTNGTAGSFAGSGNTYTASITPTAAGLVTVSVPADVATDAATNGNTVSNTLSRTFDNADPSVVISSTATDPTSVSPIPVTITFSESVTGFVLADISVTNGTAGSFAGSGAVYTATITPAAAGLVTVSVAAGVAADAATNGNTVSNTLSRTFDNSVPSVVISSTATEPTSVSPIPVTITFSESVTGFVLADISVTNGTAGSFAGSGAVYTATITPAATGLVTVSVAAGVAADAATNGNTASNTLSRTFDNSDPSVVISSTATEPTSVSPIPVTITFSESVTGFVLADISVTNGTAGSFAGSGAVYTATITPAAAGLVTVSVAAGVAADAATNGNTASNTLSRTFDNADPSVVISSTATEPTSVSPIPVTITFSESVTGFVLADISVTNGTAGSFAGSGTIYTATITPAAAGLVTVSVAAGVAADAATNGNTVSNTLSRTFDNSVPSVVISSTATEPTSVSPIPVTITFSESVTGFAIGDITVTNGTAGSFAGSGTTYTASITPTAAGLVTVSVPADVATDAATNGNTVSNTLSRTFDNSDPSVVISSTATDPTSVSPIPVTITFSESVTGFVLADISVTNGTAGSFAGSGAVYTATITPAAAGLVTVSVAAGVAADAATNGNTASNTLSRTFDNSDPSVVISSTATEPTSVSPIPVTITFSESVTGFVLADISVTNGTAGSFAGSGAVYTATITPAATGLVTVSVAAGVAADAATNGNTASNTLSRTFDNSDPSVVISSTATEPTSVSPIPVTITFSESVTGFVLADISVTNGTAGSFAGSGAVYTATITPAAAGLVTVSVAANVATDAATNGNTASNTLSRTFDNSVPSVVISSTATEPTSVSPIPVTITFSESVTGFVLADISVTNGTAGSFAGSGAVYTATITPAAAGLVTVSVAAGVATDAATNGNTASNTLSRTYDNVPPSVAITSTAAEPTSVSPIPVTITFSESVTGFVIGDITVTNGTAGSFAGSGTTYTASITPTASGVVNVSIAANVAADAAANGNTGLAVGFTYIAPTITVFSPASGALGATVTISGTNLSTIPEENIVRFNGVLANVTASTSTSITAIVPSGATTGKISVTVSGVTLVSADTFTVLASPTISVLSPGSGAVGTPVTITGTNFLTTPSVSFNGIPASVNTFTTTSITTNVPVGAGTGPITVTVNGVTATSGSNFTVLPTPTISTFSPASGAVGTLVNISGTNFNTTPIVSFNGTAASTPSFTQTSIDATVPAGAAPGSNPISITVNGITLSTATNFTVLPSPVITSFSPTSGAPGATITITGTNFSAPVTVRFFNGITASATFNSATSITATVPAGAADGPISVTTSGITVSSSSNFDVLATPTITSFSPVNGAVGAIITITGTNFRAPATVQFFNGVTASATFNSATSITATVPAGAIDGPISVTSSGVTVTSSSNFDVLPTPTLSSFTPASGAVGATVNITGTNFRAPATVQFFNGRTATATLNSATSITATVPSGAIDGPITVTTSGVTVTSVSNFDILPSPTISSFSPTGAAVGTTVTINGTNFIGTPVVTFNGTPAVVTGSTLTSITTSVPSGAGSGPISVTVSGVTINSSSNFIIFGTPSITSFTPTSGALNVVVTITGTNFSVVPSENTVQFNGTSSVVTASTATTITTSVPFGATTGKISVTVNGITGTSAANFTVPTPVISNFNPTSGAPGTIVILTGTSFSNVPANNVVRFNGVIANVTASTTTSITTVVPTGATSGKISVTVGGVIGTSTSDFVVLPTPTITSFTPTSGAAGAEVTINGTNFSTTPTDHVVRFNNTTALVTSSTNTSITAIVPTGATTGKISVTVNGITITSSADFTVLPRPTITSLNPSSGAVGATITINGTNFSTTPTNNAVSFNGVAATVTASTATTITVTVPAGTSTGPVSVTTSGVTITSTGNFTILPTPSIVSFTPEYGAPGAVVNIAGTNFNTTPANNVIKFNGVTSVVTAATSTSIRTTVPAGATTGKITLTLNGITVSSNTDFIVLATPTITNFSPVRGAAGATVTITGTNFSEPAGIVVKFNEVTATITEATASSLTVIVPVGASTGRITITVNGVTLTSATNFIVMPTPVITNFSPSSGLPGAIVTIGGLNFDSDEPDNVVTFNGTVAFVDAASTNAIITSVPEGATTGKISVTVNGATVYSGLDFTVLEIIPDDTTPPVLLVNNTPVEVMQGSDVTINVQFEDPETNITSAFVRVKSPSSGTEIFTSLLKSGENWEFLVPSLLIGELGIVYELQATNQKGLTYNSPAPILVKIRIPGNGLNIPYNSYGSDISNYRMISVPLDLDKPSVSDVFDELPLNDKTKWRISHYDNATNSNLELTSASTLQPGMGYWLIVKDNPGVPLMTGTGTTVNILPPFTISLKAGWNQIGNPYNFNILWSDMVSANPGVPISFRSYNGSIKNFENKTTLSVMEGGFINVQTDMQLMFPVKKNTGGRTSSSQYVLENSIDQNEWEVDFTIKQGDISNVIGGFGMRPDASEDFDIYDGFSMPRFDEFLEINHNKKLNKYHYSKDVVPTTESYVWNFKVDASNKEKQASINWNNSYFGNSDYKLVLFDELAKVWIDMKENSSYSFTAPTSFKVIYGPQNYVSREIGVGDAKIIEVSPNPSNGPINIHLFLPDWNKKYPVQLELKSLTGITLANIFTGELESGYQKLEWTGESNSTKLPAGVYLLQMRSDNIIQTIRVLLIN